MGCLIPVLRLQNVKVTDSFARDNATKNVQRSSSGWFLKFQKAESSNPTKYTAEYSSPLLLWIRLVKQMADAEGVTETLKASDQMKWVRRMNSCRDRATEIVYHQVIYT